MKPVDKNENKFFNFIKTNLESFLKENHLGVIKQYSDLVIKTSMIKHDQEVNHFSIADLQQIYFGDSGYRFIKHLLKNADEEQRLMVLENNYDFFNYEHLVVANYRIKENLKIVFKNIGKGALKHYGFQSLIESIQKDYSSEDYDELIDIFLNS